MAPWPSGKAKVCNTSIPGPIPGGASKNKSTARAVLFVFGNDVCLRQMMLALPMMTAAPNDVCLTAH